MLYIINRSINKDLQVGTMVPTKEDGSVTIDLGHGPVSVNPTYISFLVPVNSPKPLREDAPKQQVNLWPYSGPTINLPASETKMISGLTEEEYDAKLLHAFGVYAGSQAKYDPSALTDEQKELLRRDIENELKRSGGRDV